MPHNLEELGIFCVGSPGSGKTQAIARLISELKQRPDYRIVCFDRNGEFTANFYDEKQDLIFNPKDKRSLGWSHNCESASNETIAASIIPDHHHTDKFWSDSARNLLSEIYERTSNNEEANYVFSTMDTKQLKQFLGNSLFSKYFDSETTFASIISSTTTYTRFYSQLQDRENQIDFTGWAKSNNGRSLFLPLFAQDAEIYKSLYSMVFELIIRGLLSNVEREIKTAIIIDELGALQKLDSLSSLLAEGRKFKATPIIATQTTAQIDKIYGENDRHILLQGTATKLILNCRDPHTAKAMAEIIGHQEVLEEFVSDNSNTILTVREKLAVMPSEIQNLIPLQGFLMMGSGVPIVKAEITPKDYPIAAQRLVEFDEIDPSLAEDNSAKRESLMQAKLIGSRHTEISAIDEDTQLENIQVYDQFGLLVCVQLIYIGANSTPIPDIDEQRSIRRSDSNRTENNAGRIIRII